MKCIQLFHPPPKKKNYVYRHGARLLKVSRNKLKYQILHPKTSK